MTLVLSSTTYESTQTANSLATGRHGPQDSLCTGHIVAVSFASSWGGAGDASMGVLDGLPVLRAGPLRPIPSPPILAPSSSGHRPKPEEIQPT